ncbi:SGNH/GDSL hydrolase family protein [Paraliomyxa miuraensis]|uniref:SGNH/GDSL hydrolase family protein n=1 Tax=Paraliomyxa miuraensis TaxID=376150 RepID=UPI00225738AD|nr:SGNH/GDSL hydrolase family protein [Paraliomyxa miuraensis]MCX4248024.1 SGNH/GDSL hydrolase family protein [Paraliomyxa miuraensis]
MTLGCLAGLTLGGCTGDPVASDGTEGDSDGETTEATSTPADETGMSSTGTGVGTSSADGSSSGMADETSAESGSSDSGDPPGVECLDDQFVNGPSPGPNYNDFDVELGSHCQGTNHQDITDIERVVFVGDSVTVGTPPTGANDFYRSLVAEELATMFGLQAPEFLWKQYDPIGGTSVVQESGDFASCAVWGARNDDLLTQLEDCFATEDYQMRTLVITTMGGNDAAALAKDYIDGVPLADVLADLEVMVGHHEMAIQWLLDPGKFPNGVFVVNANVYEFTDATMDLLSCPAAGTAGFNGNPENPDVLRGALLHINEEYARIAGENGTDVVFMAEGFCGHGFHADDASSPCYRGPGNGNWFDFTCIHPTPGGHEALADMFINVISE